MTTVENVALATYPGARMRNGHFLPDEPGTSGAGVPSTGRTTDRVNGLDSRLTSQRLDPVQGDRPARSHVPALASGEGRHVTLAVHGLEGTELAPEHRLANCSDREQVGPVFLEPTLEIR
ncbi:hypothetical protein [Modestobacter sp. VKM Ac-2984]|uniref:hypothetical protein n=1 Tax=Modestobacter sp. VKM Ac-2984 TaxID=3004138 RepID=UPI0022A9F72C|nr:hypothetical protein [Modestobacter sp. VKM Ac-2984]MCZ2816405.1 hypothetical protein [Modestobacter sp. VKM Ac-2984]